jgi:ferric-dicitrate binding protein FerR (iron transport regulator)
LYRQNWFRLAVAAVFVIAVSLPFVWKWQGANPVPAANSTAAQHILPGGNKAVLLLADGSAVELDSAHNGALSVQGSTQVVKLADGQLAYRGKNGVPAEMMYNTISTPRGGQYRLTLADGSQVWLNAASQLRFPVAFGSAERRVELLGEAYFEVAKSNAPFKVLVAGKSEVEVLGTHFNINSYADEAAISTTLLEGSVRVSKPGGGDFVTLQPGQQARVNEKIDVLTGVDTDEMVAWKEGWFHFNRADVGAIMRQVSRWYDVDVVFEGNARKKTFSGIVSRSNDVGEVLRIMETAGVRFRIEGKRITVIQ